VTRLDPAEKVARAAARVVDSIGAAEIERARETHSNVKGVGGSHYISNGRLIALADAVADWKAAQRRSDP
jgi:hypothetical protein